MASIFDIIKAFKDTQETAAVNAQNFTIATQTSGYRNPTWVSRYPIADVSYPDCMNLLLITSGNTSAQTAGTAHTHNIDNDAAGPIALGSDKDTSIGAYVTISNPTVMNTIGLYVWKASGTANNIFLEVFKENPATTAVTRIYSVNITASLGTSAVYLEHTLTSSIIVQSGERYVVRIRNSSTLTCTIAAAGLTRSSISPDIAFATVGSGLTAQTSYTAGEVVTAHAANVSFPFVMLAAVGLPVTEQSFSDDFNRATFGGLWVPTSDTGANQMLISADKATFTGSTNGSQNNVFTRSCNDDTDRVDCDVYDTAFATTGARLGPFLHAAQDLSQMVFLGVTFDSVNIYSGSSASLTSRATISSTLNDGRWSLIYDEPTNTYTALKDGLAVGLSWVDSGPVITHGAGYRFGGIRIGRTTAVNAGEIDNWTLRDWM